MLAVLAAYSNVGDDKVSSLWLDWATSPLVMDGGQSGVTTRYSEPNVLTRLCASLARIIEMAMDSCCLLPAGDERVMYPVQTGSRQMQAAHSNGSKDGGGKRTYEVDTSPRPDRSTSTRLRGCSVSVTRPD